MYCCELARCHLVSLFVAEVSQNLVEELICPLVAELRTRIELEGTLGQWRYFPVAQRIIGNPLALTSSSILRLILPGSLLPDAMCSPVGLLLTPHREPFTYARLDYRLQLCIMQAPCNIEKLQ